MKLAGALVARYVKMTEGIGIFAPRSQLYQGMVAALSGNLGLSVHHWHQGLANCPEDDLRYDRARLHWMLSLHGTTDAEGHLQAARRHFDECGVAGPPYPLIPCQRLGA